MSYSSAEPNQRTGLEIAVIGMSGRFPGARTINEFWQNLTQGVEAIAHFTDEELLASGADSALLQQSNYVKAGAVLEDIDRFDAAFFGFNPREAEITDPQHRLFLECAWEALEHAGYDPDQYQGAIGIYAGASLNRYLLDLYANREVTNTVDPFQLVISNDKDFLTTRASYKLNLEGPSYTVQTACSTSLVAVHLACQGLLSGECDIALSGGVSIRLPQKTGYLYQEGSILSPDGHCRAFDARAQGTVGGNGIGLVVLKRLEDALADGDCIYAVVRGSAINNDGSAKVSYTAPRIDGQAKVIRAAQSVAEVDPQTISYIEAHGTGTALGDPIEVAALTQVFRARTAKAESDAIAKQAHCAIGSVKTNIGHLDAAAGIAGFIKTVLALKHGQIPPSLHFEQPNPQIDFANSPFYVNTTLTDWTTNGTPRRAGVSSFGIGGTNAHVILEEAPAITPSGQSRPFHLIVISAKTASALETATTNLANYLEQNSDANLADVAYTLQVGRRAWEHRRALVCCDRTDAITALNSRDPQRLLSNSSTNSSTPPCRSVVFMFPGQGAQYVTMGQALYQTEPIVREHIDRCCDLLKPHLGLDLRHVLYPNEFGSQEPEAASTLLNQTAYAQPALFVMEYALAQLMMTWGVRPIALVGHSIGEYVAACLAGVFSLEEALALVAVRGRLMQQLPGGAMLSVSLSEADVLPFLNPDLSLAASNAPQLCVVSGSIEAIADLHQQLTQQGIASRLLHTSHAFHSAMMDSILAPFTEQVQQVRLNPPQIPMISNVTGTWITAEEAMSPSYWATHLRQTVRFSAGMMQLAQTPDSILLEVGPGHTLSTLAKQHSINAGRVVSLLRHPHDHQSDVAVLLRAVGQLWLAGIPINWSEMYAQENRHRLPLPTYPFERQRYWIEPQAKTADRPLTAEELTRKPNQSDWFYLPSWKQRPLLRSRQDDIPLSGCWLIFLDQAGVGGEIARSLEQAGHEVIRVVVGERFTQVDSLVYALNPQCRRDYDALLNELNAQDKILTTVIHCWSATPIAPASTSSQDPVHLKWEQFQQSQTLGFYSLLFLTQAIQKQAITTPISINVVTNQLHDVIGEPTHPEYATVLGLCHVIPQECANITCRNIDLAISDTASCFDPDLIDSLITELKTPCSAPIVAYRKSYRWIQTVEPVPLDIDQKRLPLQDDKVYLIVENGTHGSGASLAKHLSQTVQSKLIWMSDSDLPTLEQSGAKWLRMKVDVSNPSQMQSALDQICDRYGQIHGVFYLPEMNANQSAVLIQDLDRADCEQQFQNVRALMVLEQVLRDRNLDFCLVQSSLSTVLGGLGLAAYAAAYQFVDAFVQQQPHSAGWISVNRQAIDSSPSSWPDSTSDESVQPTELAMTPYEVWQAFQVVLSARLTGRVVVSTADLATRIKHSIKLQPMSPKSTSQEPLSPHSRPNLPNAYVAPRDEMERSIASIWQDFLGVKPIGIYDNFFELGGHSLLAVQVISRLRDIFQVELPLRVLLFEAPTIAGLASAIVALQPNPDELDAMAQLLEEVQRLSPLEAQQQLAQDSQSS